MRVNQSGTNSIQNAEAAKTSATDKSAKSKRPSSVSEGGSSANAAASAELSSKSKEFAKARQTAMDSPDVREDKIAEIKKRLAAGTYSVDADAVADRMVSEHMSMG